MPSRRGAPERASRVRPDRAGPGLRGRLGVVADRVTQGWVRWTGREVDLASTAWLDGPRGESRTVGEGWLPREAARVGGRVHRAPGLGLLGLMGVLDGPGLDVAALRPEVRRFYERTGDWRLEVWSQWSTWAWPFGWLVSTLFARRLQQLSLPLRPLDVAAGMTSRVEQVRGPAQEVLGASWFRTLRSTGGVVYSGWYSTARLPGADRRSVRVVFPLPNGRLVVALRPDLGPDGSLLLTSGPGRFGDDGAYLVVQRETGSRAWARRIPVHERFRVYVDPEGTLRTDHALTLGRWPVLRLHYRLEERSPG